MPKRKPMLTKKQSRLLGQLQAALNLQAAAPRMNKPIVFAQQAAVMQATLNQIYPQLINDTFFKSSPLQDYMRSKGFGDDTDYIAPHEPGQLCEHNPYCEECYA